MAALHAALAEALEFAPESFRAFASNINEEWVKDALGRVEGFAELRRRKLPVDRALWLVIGMGLFRDRSLAAVVDHLNIVLPSALAATVAPSAITQARRRLGVEPVVRLFELTAAKWSGAEAGENRWRGLALYGADGTCMRVADTAENEAAFGRPTGSKNRGRAGYPQVRAVGLMALRSHVLAALNFGPYRASEQTLVEPLWEKVPDHSLTILDRGFISWWALWSLASRGNERHWLVRARKNLTWRRLKKLGRSDDLVEIEVQKKLRHAHPEMPRTITARVLVCRQKGYRPYRVITSMVDADRFPADEIRVLYRERWELELGYDELKTHMLEREESLRSRTPDGVRQEIAGLALAFNLVRVEMARVARDSGVPAIRLSFRHALLLIRNFCLTAWATAPGTLPRQLGNLERDLRLLILPPRRSERRYPRHVKIKMTNYARNPGRSARNSKVAA